MKYIGDHTNIYQYNKFTNILLMKIFKRTYHVSRQKIIPRSRIIGEPVHDLL